MRRSHRNRRLLLLAMVLAAAHRASAAPPEPARHWAYVPVRRPIPLEVVEPAWAGNPIDRFVRAKLAAEGIEPAPAADRRIWIRRLYLDLIGLPPTPEDVNGFLEASSPAAVAKVVDRLLASPHYGERWARHWMDVVRYADTNGYERDGAKPHAWRFR